MFISSRKLSVVHPELSASATQPDVTVDPACKSSGLRGKLFFLSEIRDMFSVGLSQFFVSVPAVFSSSACHPWSILRFFHLDRSHSKCYQVFIPTSVPAVQASQVLCTEFFYLLKHRHHILPVQLSEWNEPNIYFFHVFHCLVSLIIFLIVFTIPVYVWLILVLFIWDHPPPHSVGLLMLSVYTGPVYTYLSATPRLTKYFIWEIFPGDFLWGRIWGFHAWSTRSWFTHIGFLIGEQPVWALWKITPGFSSDTVNVYLCTPFCIPSNRATGTPW
jgi:hypothetical protein